MKFPTLDELKMQSKVEGNEEDVLFVLYLDAAKQRAETYLNLKIFEDEIPEDCSNGIVLTADMKLALILYVNHRYEYRDPSKTPEGFYELIKPYRNIPL